jgi:hypothetical protein
MSIIIKGMEMPTNCFECSWRCKVDPENLLCRISGEYFEETFSGTIQNRHKSCPLVPVPPHGRLGDLDALMEKDNDDFSKIMEMTAPATVFSTALADAHTAIQEFLKAAPTIIPAEEGE